MKLGTLVRSTLIATICYSSILHASVVYTESSDEDQKPNAELSYDCSAEETAVFIEKASINTLSASPITLPDVFMKAYTQQKQEEGDEGCVSIFTDGKLNREWERILEDIKEFDFNISVSNPSLNITKEMIKKAIKKQINKALERLTKDICNLVSSDNLLELAKDKANEKFGLDNKMDMISDYRETLLEDGLLGVAEKDPKIKAFTSADELKRDLKERSRSEIRKVRKDIWDAI